MCSYCVMTTTCKHTHVHTYAHTLKHSVTISIAVNVALLQKKISFQLEEACVCMCVCVCVCVYSGVTTHPPFNIPHFMWVYFRRLFELPCVVVCLSRVFATCLVMVVLLLSGKSGKKRRRRRRRRWRRCGRWWAGEVFPYFTLY